MKNGKVSTQFISDIFREEALLIGSLVATHDIDDEIVWALCRNLDQIRLRFQRKLGRANRRRENPRNSLNAKPHPAVLELLRRLRGN